MNDRKFSYIEIFQHSGKGIPLFMTRLKNYQQPDYLLRPGPRLIKKNLPGRGLTKVEIHCSIYSHLKTVRLIFLIVRYQVSYQ
jgi:hypothetical protein